MDNTRIIELFIDDEYEEAGIEAISLVSKPAHDEEWMAFNSQKPDGSEEFSPYTIAEENFCDNNPKLDELGESSSIMEQEGWEIVKMEKMTPSMVFKMGQEKFSKPNEDSPKLDTDDLRIRFKYIGPVDDRNRKFCADMMSKNRIYRIEDIEQLSNPEFGPYNIFLFRGSYNCRHAWVRLYYKKEGKIRNSGLSNTNKELPDEVVIGADTRNDGTKSVGRTGNYKGPNGPGTGRPAPGINVERDRDPRDGSQFSKQPFKPNRFEEKGLTEMMFGFDEDKKIVVGAAMVPNKMIHRYDDLGNMYYVFFSAASIKKMADKFMKQGRTDETSIEHDGKKLGSDKVYIAESWVSDNPIYDKSHQYGFSLPAGTWFVSMKVEDEKVWKMIKEKSLTGFSVEGLFAEKSIFSKEDKKINQIRKILKSITDEQ